MDVLTDAAHAMQKYIHASLARDLPRRLEQALGGRGRVEVTVDAVRSFPLLESSPTTGIVPASPAAEEAARYDKVLHLEVRESHVGLDLTAHDYDAQVRYLCPPARRQLRQPSRIVDAALQTILAAYAPVAEFQQITDDAEHVELIERFGPAGAGAAREARIRAGDVLVPVLRRVDASGESVLAATEAVPWTVLVVERADSDAGDDGRGPSGAETDPTSTGRSADRETSEQPLLARVESASRRALGVRRRGRIEQLAIVVRPAPAPVTLRLLTQTEPHQPLPGCTIFLRDAPSDEAAQAPVGVSDLSGLVELSPTESPVQLVWIKSGELLLAKLPVVWGLTGELDVPLAEDPARIRAAADLRALRTELVDLVARRNILLARGRAAIADSKLDEARSLADELDKLPTRAQFNQRIDFVANTARSPDRLTQSRIDRLVEETRSVLGEYLDPREISQLRSEINNAAK